MAQYAAYCIIKLRWSLPELLVGVMTVPQCDVPKLLDNLSYLRCYRAFVMASIDWWVEEEKKAHKKAKEGGTA